MNASRAARLVVDLPTSEGELIEIFRFRYRIYIEEMGKQLACANHATKQLRDWQDDSATHLCIWDNGEVVGSMRINWGGKSSFFALGHGKKGTHALYLALEEMANGAAARH